MPDRLRLRLCLLAFLLSGAAGGLAAQTPEPPPEPGKEKKTSPPGTVFTNDDLAKYGSGAPEKAKASPKPGVASPPGGRAAGSAPYDETARRLQEKEWRARAAGQRAAIAKAEKKVASLQAKVDGLASGLAPQPIGDPNMLATLENEKNKAIQDLQGAKAELADARKGMDDLEELARRRSIPPGWLRE